MPRLRYVSDRVRAAERFGVTVLDLYPHAFAADPRMGSPDRLHASEAGCVRLADAFAAALGVPARPLVGDGCLPERPELTPVAEPPGLLAS